MVVVKKEIKVEEDKPVVASSTIKKEPKAKKPKPLVSATKLFLNGLAPSTTKDSLEATFSAIGPLRSCFVLTYPGSSTCNGTGFVIYALEEDATAAVAKYHRTELDGSTIAVRRAKPKSERPAKKEPATDKPAAPVHIIQPKPKKPKTEKPTPKTEDSIRTVIVKGLPPKITAKNLVKKAKKIGAVDKVVLIHKEPGNAKTPVVGAHIIFISPEDSRKALKLDNHVLKGKTIQVEHMLGTRAFKVNPRAKVIFRNLAFQVTKADVKELCAPYGIIVSIEMPVPLNVTQKNVHNRGFAFVTFAEKAEAEKALAALNGKKLSGRVVAVDWAVEKDTFKKSQPEATEDDDIKKESDSDASDESGDDDSDDDSDASEPKSGEEDSDGSEEDDEDDEDDEEEDSDDNKKPQKKNNKKKGKASGGYETDSDEEEMAAWAAKKAEKKKDKKVAKNYKKQGDDSDDDSDEDDDDKEEKMRRLREEFDEDYLDAGASADKDEYNDDVDSDEEAADNDEDIDNKVSSDEDFESEEEEEEEDEEAKERWRRTDLNEGAEHTIFVRGLGFDITDTTLKQKFSNYGPVQYARIVMDDDTGISRGVGFVRFKNQNSLDQVLADFKEIENERKTKASASVKAGNFILQGQDLQVDRAVSKRNLDKYLHMKYRPDEKLSNRRNMHLLTVAEPPADNRLTKNERAMWRKITKERAEKVKNANFHMSATRLVLYNLPPEMKEAELKKLFSEAGAKDGKLAKIRHAKVVRDKKMLDEAGTNISLGTAYIEFFDPSNAYEAVNEANLREGFLEGSHRKIIAQFAIDNRLRLHRREQKQQRLLQVNDAMKKTPVSNTLADAISGKHTLDLRLQKEEKRQASAGNAKLVHGKLYVPPRRIKEYLPPSAAEKPTKQQKGKKRGASQEPAAPVKRSQLTQQTDDILPPPTKKPRTSKKEVRDDLDNYANQYFKDKYTAGTIKGEEPVPSAVPKAGGKRWWE